MEWIGWSDQIRRRRVWRKAYVGCARTVHDSLWQGIYMRGIVLLALEESYLGIGRGVGLECERGRREVEWTMGGRSRGRRAGVR